MKRLAFTLAVILVGVGALAVSVQAQEPERKQPPREVAPPPPPPSPPPSVSGGVAVPRESTWRSGSDEGAKGRFREPDEFSGKGFAVGRELRHGQPALIGVSGERSSGPSSRSHESIGLERELGANKGIPRYSRPRDGRPVVGEAIPRSEAPTPNVLNPTFYVPYAYRTYYDPFWYGSFGLGYFYYDPFWWGYSGGWPTGYGVYGPYQYSYGTLGALRLKVKPREAQVYADGYYVGRVDDFDGVFQRLQLDPGPHRVEIRADGYVPLSFNVRIYAGETMTYRDELQRIQ